MDSDEHLARAVRQIQDLLAWVGDGRKLTQTGRLTRTDARVLVEKLDTGDEIDPSIEGRVYKTQSSVELVALTSLVEWAKAASLLRVVKGRLVQVKKHRKLLDDPEALRSRLFDALSDNAFAVGPGFRPETLVVVDYRAAFQTIVALLYVHGSAPMSMSKIADVVWDNLSPRWRLDELTEFQLNVLRKANGRDSDTILEHLAALGVVRVDGDDVDMTDVGWAQLARYRGERLPGAEVWRLRIELLDVTKPVVWRRIDLSPTVELAELHGVIQAAMGWESSHLHCFRTDDGTTFGPTGSELEFQDETAVTVADIVSTGREAIYTYDLGDDWEHRISLELTTTAQEGRSYPYCFDGAGACPAEDSGGAGGWAFLKSAIADPSGDEHDEYLTWLGLASPDQFDPKGFDLALANKRLRAIV